MSQDQLPKSYEEEIDFQFVTGGSNTIVSKPLQTGEMIQVTHIGATFQNIATTEYVELGYYNGHAYIPLYKGVPPETGDYVFWDGAIYLREGQFLYAYLKDVENGEVMKLRANGEWIKW